LHIRCLLTGPLAGLLFAIIHTTSYSWALPSALWIAAVRDSVNPSGGSQVLVNALTGDVKFLVSGYATNRELRGDTPIPYRGPAGFANERRELARSSIKLCQLLQLRQAEFHDSSHPREKGANRASAQSSDPRSAFRFSSWAVPDHQRVSRTIHFKIQIPAKVFLTGLFISCDALFPQFADQPHCDIVSETARIDEIVLRLSHVESCAFECDNRLNLRVHRSRSNCNALLEPSPD
jgi:hypothetical protein